MSTLHSLHLISIYVTLSIYCLYVVQGGGGVIYNTFVVLVTRPLHILTSPLLYSTVSFLSILLIMLVLLIHNVIISIPLAIPTVPIAVIILFVIIIIIVPLVVKYFPQLPIVVTTYSTLSPPPIVAKLFISFCLDYPFCISTTIVYSLPTLYTIPIVSTIFPIVYPSYYGSVVASVPFLS